MDTVALGQDVDSRWMRCSDLFMGILWYATICCGMLRCRVCIICGRPSAGAREQLRRQSSGDQHGGPDGAAQVTFDFASK